MVAGTWHMLESGTIGTSGLNHLISLSQGATPLFLWNPQWEKMGQEHCYRSEAGTELMIVKPLL